MMKVVINILTAVFCVSALKDNSIMKYYFEGLCGNPAVSIPDQGHVLLSHSRTSFINDPCTVSIYNPDVMTSSTNQPAVLVYFDSFYTDCSFSHMTIYDSPGADPNKTLTGKNGMCGSKSYTYFYSTQKYMTFQLNGNSHSFFEMVVTSVHNGTCQYNEFGCSNGFCIHDNLVLVGTTIVVMAMMKLHAPLRF